MSNIFKTAVLMVALTLLLILVGNLIGGKNGATIAFLLALVMNLGAYWFSDKIVLTMYGAQEISERDEPSLFRLLKRLTGREGLPMPKLYLIPSATPNAFATGRNPKHAAVALTSGVLQLLDSDELEGVIAHELTHVKNRDILLSAVVAALAGAIMMIARMAQWAALFGGFGGRSDEDRGGGLGPLGYLFLIVLAPLAALLIQLAISRSREYLADEGGAYLSGKPLSLARALKKLAAGVEMVPMENASPATAHMFIVNPLRESFWADLFSTHPSLSKRVARLEAIAKEMR